MEVKAGHGRDRAGRLMDVENQQAAKLCIPHRTTNQPPPVATGYQPQQSGCSPLLARWARWVDRGREPMEVEVGRRRGPAG